MLMSNPEEVDKKAANAPAARVRPMRVPAMPADRGLLGNTKTTESSAQTIKRRSFESTQHGKNGGKDVKEGQKQENVTLWSDDGVARPLLV